MPSDGPFQFRPSSCLDHFGQNLATGSLTINSKVLRSSPVKHQAPAQYAVWRLWKRLAWREPHPGVQKKKNETLDKNALRKQEAEANRRPSAHAARIPATKAAAKEKAKARKQENADKRAANAERNGQSDNVQVAQDQELGCTDQDGNFDISGRL